jgi:hypothetical protein
MFARAVAVCRRLLGSQPQSEPWETGQAVDEDRRVWVRHSADLETTCQPAASPDSKPFSARVRNISCRGISLLVDRSFEPGELLSVELPGLAEGSTYTVLACVVHARAEGDDGWVLGCSFARELSNEDLEAFGARRQRPRPPDQRAWMRFPSTVTVSCELVNGAQTQRWTAQVLDISTTGISLLVTRLLTVGMLLSVDLHGGGPQEPTILASVVHVTPRGDGEWALGCNFIRSLSEEELQALG